MTYETKTDTIFHYSNLPYSTITDLGNWTVTAAGRDLKEVLSTASVSRELELREVGLVISLKDPQNTLSHDTYEQMKIAIMEAFIKDLVASNNSYTSHK